MSARKRKKSVALIDSSDSDGGGDINAEVPRSSERIRQKQKREFHLPSRDDVWEKISPTKSPSKYAHLKPRALVNNFTKVNNRYNYDPNETSGSESMDEFIADDGESDGSSSSHSLKHVSPRIIGRRKRLTTISDSAESEDSSAEFDVTVGGDKSGAAETKNKSCASPGTSKRPGDWEISTFTEGRVLRSRSCKDKDKRAGQRIGMSNTGKGHMQEGRWTVTEMNSCNNDNSNGTFDQTMNNVNDDDVSGGENGKEDDVIITPVRVSSGRKRLSLCVSSSESDTEEDIVTPRTARRNRSLILDSDETDSDSNYQTTGQVSEGAGQVGHPVLKHSCETFRISENQSSTKSDVDSLNNACIKQEPEDFTARTGEHLVNNVGNIDCIVKEDKYSREGSCPATNKIQLSSGEHCNHGDKETAQVKQEATSKATIKTSPDHRTHINDARSVKQEFTHDRKIIKQEITESCTNTIVEGNKTMDADSTGNKYNSTMPLAFSSSDAQGLNSFGIKQESKDVECTKSLSINNYRSNDDDDDDDEETSVTGESGRQSDSSSDDDDGSDDDDDNDDNNDNGGDDDGDDDDDDDTESSDGSTDDEAGDTRVRVRMLKKKKQKARLFEQFRQERERKLKRQKSLLC